MEQHQRRQLQKQLYFQNKTYFSRGEVAMFKQHYLLTLISFKPCIEDQTFEGMCLSRILCKIKLLLSVS